MEDLGLVQEDHQEMKETINNMLALAFIYDDMDKHKVAIKLFEAANDAAVSQDIRLDSRARAHWGQVLLAVARTRQEAEKGATLIVDTSIEDDDEPDAIEFLPRQNKLFHKYLGENASSKGCQEAKNDLLDILFNRKSSQG